MGKRGPAPTPTNLKILRGNPGHRPLNDKEPRPDADRVRCPSRLSPDAKKIWREIAPSLKRLGLLTNLDVSELAKFCEMEAMYRREIAWVVEHGSHMPIRGRSIYNNEGKKVAEGNIIRLIKTPAFVSAMATADRASRIAAKFGMTPSDRTALKVTGKETTESAMEEYLKRRGQPR